MGNATLSESFGPHLCRMKGRQQNCTQFEYFMDEKERQFWKKNVIICNVKKNIMSSIPENKSHPSFSQISKDIPRTFPDQIFLKNTHNVLRFKQILRQFCFYFPKIGYTQGLNFITGYLLLAGFTDSQALEILISLALHQKLLFIGLYEDSFPLVRTYCSLFWKLLDRKMPQFADKIRNSKLPDQAWIFQWFISFFLSTFPISFVKKFLDYIFWKKECSMVTLAIGIIHCLTQDLNDLIDPDQFQLFQFFDSLRSVEFCKKKIKVRRVLTYANSISNTQIKEALAQCKIKNNIYYVYFLKDTERKEIWYNIIDKLARQRKMFKEDRNSAIYKRNKDLVNHLDNFLKEKAKHYHHKSNSKLKKFQKTSNFSTDFEEQEEFLKTTGFSESNIINCNGFCKQVPMERLQFSSFYENYQ